MATKKLRGEERYCLLEMLVLDFGRSADSVLLEKVKDAVACAITKSFTSEPNHARPSQSPSLSKNKTL